MFEEALLVFVLQDMNLEWNGKFAAAVQKAVQCCCIISDEKEKKIKERYTMQTSLDHLSQEAR